MRVTYPHIGYLSAPVAYMLENLGVDTVQPPPITQKTVELGSRNSPEGACLPYKISTGTLLEALDQNADTFITMCGAGKCRFGFYGAVQKTVLSRNSQIQFFSLNTEHLPGDLYRLLRKLAPRTSFLAIAKNIALTVHKLQALDALTQAKNHFGARTQSPEKTIKAFAYGIGEIAGCENFGEVTETKAMIIDTMRSYQDPHQPPPPKVAMVGEFYVLLEPYVNRWLEDVLLRQGIEVKKFVYTGDWAYAKILLQTLGLYREEQDGKKNAQPYLHYHVGGEGLKSVGIAAWCAKHGYAGVVHVFPFGCMPEVVARYALKNVSDDYGLPLLPLSVDEHASDVGIMTRLEAFADCIRRKHRVE